jgi:hypothetical protein
MFFMIGIDVLQFVVVTHTTTEMEDVMEKSKRKNF